MLQELAYHAVSPAYLQSDNATPESRNSKAERKIALICNACDTMTDESILSFESLVYSIKDGTLTFQQLIAISERLMAVSDKPSTDLTFTRAMDQVSFCKTGLDRAHTTSNCPHVSNPETFIRGHNRTSTSNKVETLTIDQMEGSLQGLGERHPLCNHRFSPSN